MNTVNTKQYPKISFKLQKSNYLTIKLQLEKGENEKQIKKILNI